MSADESVTIKSGKETYVLDPTLVDIVPNATGPPGYKCKKCDVFYPRKWHMKLHIRTHTGEKPYICGFQECNKAFPRPGSLSEHKRKIHEKLVQHVCPICDKKFYARSEMLKHIVIHDEARTVERILPPQMLKLLSETEELNYDGQTIASNCVCDKCGKIFNKKSLKERHINQVHSKANKCLASGCGKSFSSESGLSSHANKCNPVKSETLKLEKEDHNEIWQSYKCDVSDCSKVFDTKSGVDKHIKNGDHLGEFFFSCSKCPKKFASTLALKIHCRDPCESVRIKDEDVNPKEEFVKDENMQQEAKISEESKHGDLQFSCDLCERVLSTKESLYIHKLIHRELTRFTCKERDCTDVFSNYKSLTLHLKVSHGIVKKNENRMFHTCEDCGKQCTTKAGLQGHMLRHSKEKNYVCIECGKRLKRKASLTLHMKIHAGEKNYHCDQCDAKYVSSPALRNHTLSMHTDMSDAVPFMCSYCGNEFKKKHYLLKHITVHTGEKNFECSVCPKKFRLEISMENHMNMHNGIKKYQCPHCDKKFIQRQQRTVHVRRHTGDKRHKCTKCEMGFIEPAGLRHHTNRHHIL